MRHFNQRLRWNDGPDRVFGNWLLIDVHATDLDELPAGHTHEFDFWCSNGKGVYLLRLRWTEEKQLSIVRSKSGEAVTCLVAEGPFEKITNELLQQVIADFERVGVPRWP